MKTYDSYVKVIEAIDCYDDGVLLEAREFALALCGATEPRTDPLLDEMNGAYEEDCRAIGEWDAEEELCTDAARLNAVLAREDMQAAMDRWDHDEDRTTALLLLLRAMLTRSVAYERMYT